jgi:long-chain acyl-CoA synthetase
MTDFIKEACPDPSSEKIFYFNRVFTAERVFGDIARVACFLKKSGVCKGDSVVICLPNIPQAVTALYAINSVGAIANIVHPKIGADGLLKIVRESKTKWVFMFDRFIKKHRRTLAAENVKIISCRLTDYMSGFMKTLRITEPVMCFYRNVIPYKAALAESGETDVEVKGSDTAVYLHSSGTTGDSKTVVLSNYALNELAQNIFDTSGGKKTYKPNYGMLMILPLFHGFGMGVCVHFTLFFGHIILQPSFNPKTTVRILKKRKVEMIPLVPNMLRKLIATKGFEGAHLRNLTHIYVGGDKLDAALFDKAKEILVRNGSECLICEGFGLSETASVTNINIVEKKGGTVGRPISRVEEKIIENGAEQPPMKEGDIYISSPSLMSGYLSGEASNISVDANGVKWLDTGDRGYMDEDGFLYYRGRIKRLLKIGGVNIYPQEVEAVACAIPEIVNSCAIRTTYNGKPALKLLVITKNGVKLTPVLRQKICSSVESHILPYAVPRIIESAEELRLTGMGKTDYRYYEEREKEKK